ncbi:MAG TPA: dihydrofolate reductase family protein [Candidatus Acidoferrales bacterium]|nr:dihydrofolate reductase family protein [Candidatus Acidoferrales bacterium]
MRKSQFGVACTLDAYIARKDHGTDWILSSEEATSLMKDLWKTIDTVITGRKTYELVLNSGKPWPSFPGVKNYVCSRTLRAIPDKHVQIISEDAADFVRKLKSEKGKDIFVMGGGELAKSLLEAGLIDEIRLSIHPLLLGSGIPLFLPMKHQIDLELLDSKVFKNGCVCVTYGVKHGLP